MNEAYETWKERYDKVFKNWINAGGYTPEARDLEKTLGDMEEENPGYVERYEAELAEVKR